ncbi:MAG: hypothetical protein HY678_01535 [Chloroflexi bacterium]|nr:hypothetical protein [Chloroflexota bacterium]
MVTALRTTNRPLPPGMEHHVGWFTPQPLWQKLARDELLSKRGHPAILRFQADTFMEDVLGLLEATPERLSEHVAQPETWREPDVGLTEDGHDKPGLLKLFQSNQSRFYLVGGVLACKLPGVPDHQPDTAQRESVFFVLRRLIYDHMLGRDVEYAWATGQSTTQTALPDRLRPLLRSRVYQEAPSKGWMPVANPGQAVVANEERLPLFPMRFKLQGVPRTLYAGMVPVSSRETYRATGVIDPSPSGGDFGKPGGDPRDILFSQQVTEPLRHLRSFIMGLEGSYAQQDRDVLSRAFLYLLLDLMALLRDSVPSLYGDIIAGRSVTGGLGDLIEGVADRAGRALTGYLRVIERDRAQIEGLEADDDLQDEWVFPLTREQLDFVVPRWLNKWLAPMESTAQAPIEREFHRAKRPYQQPDEGPLTLTPESARIEASTGARYVLRMVYDKPCCGEVTISEPSRPFTLAPFFDPDAPARKIRIPLPGDTSIEGLRKFDKGVVIELSKQLRAQMQRISGLQNLMDGKVNKEEGLDFGMTCSLSVPIITVCALILLMIIVQLLNVVFWWLPFFKVCLPIRR